MGCGAWVRADADRVGAGSGAVWRAGGRAACECTLAAGGSGGYSGSANSREWRGAADGVNLGAGAGVGEDQGGRGGL